MAKIPLRTQFKRAKRKRNFLFHWSQYYWECCDCDLQGPGNTLHVGKAHRTNSEKKEGFPHDVIVKHKEYGNLGPIYSF